MDIFQKDKDLYITESGRARNRAPEDLMEVPLQHGTILNQEMINAWTFELYNLIKALGITPDREKEDQIAEGLEKKLLYDRVGEIRSYLTGEMNHPLTEAVLDGRTLYASNYEDGLAMLKKRCPSWVSGENVRLPRLEGRFAKVQTSSLGYTQEDGMREIKAKIEGVVKRTGNMAFNVPGDLTAVVGKWLPVDWSKGRMTGEWTFGAFESTWTRLGGLIFSPGKVGETWASGAFSYILQEDDRRITFSGGADLDVGATIKQPEGKVGKENRPKNFAVIMTVVAGIPKR